jgi:hypothetical protein
MWIISCTLFLTGCMSGGRHASQLHSERERRMTLGTVQREIREGMSETDVVTALGSPNIVTRDNKGLTSWVYDKIATEASFSTDRGGAAGGVGAGGIPGQNALILGGVGGNYGKNAGAAATTQRTLTVIIKFNDSGLVDSFSYHSSRF